MKYKLAFAAAFIIVTKFALAQSIEQGASLADQQRCSEYAHMKFNRDQAESEKQAAALGIKLEPFALMQDLTGQHYNQKLNRCFMETKTMQTFMSPESTKTIKLIVDAYEGTNIAEYVWESKKDKKYWEVPPEECRVKLPSGEEKECHSENEFDQLASPYIPAGLSNL